MPTIPLQGTPEDACFLQAVMVYPDDPVRREQEFYTLLADSLSHAQAPTEQVTVSAACLSTLLSMPTRDARLKLRTNAIRRGSVSGSLLAFMYLMDHFKLPEPSMGKAEHVASVWAKQHSHWNDGVAINAGRTNIREDWRRYRSVAHFWGALRLLQLYVLPGEPRPFSAEWMPAFLGISQSLYNFGLEYWPSKLKPKQAFLDAGTSWVLPATIAEKRIVRAALPEFLSQALKTYRPRSR